MTHRTTSWNAPYTFSGKEKDVETGYGYFGARYYDSGLSIWLSVDPMSDKYPSMSPYNYCGNNPLVLTDPDGNTAGDYVNANGEIIGKDGANDNIVYLVSDPTSIATIKNNQTTPTGSVNIDVTTTYSVLYEVIDVYKRTINNGGMREEATTMIPNFATPFISPSGNLCSWDVTPSATFNPYHKGRGGVFIHSHPFYLVYQNPDFPSGKPQFHTFIPSTRGDGNDRDNFTGFSLNIIVGQMKDPKQQINLVTGQYSDWAFPSNSIGAGFYNSNTELKFQININNLIKLKFDKCVDLLNNCSSN